MLDYDRRGRGSKPDLLLWLFIAKDSTRELQSKFEESDSFYIEENRLAIRKVFTGIKQKQEILRKVIHRRVKKVKEISPE